MNTGGGRRGRRDNGLVAAEYAIAGDVDPRIGEHLLDVLGAGGIAAYLQPAADLHPITRTTTMPARPTDRLYVDRNHLETARGYLAQLTEGITDGPESGPLADQAASRADTGVPADASMPARAPASPSTPATPPATAASASTSDIDEQWAQIVASLNAEAEAESRPWPDASALTGRRPPPAREVTQEPTLLDALDTFGAGLPDEDEGSFTPPPPPPLPRPPAAVVLAIIAIVGGFVLFVRPDLLPLDRDLVQPASFLALLAGVAALILRLRPGNEEENDQDDGAVV